MRWSVLLSVLLACQLMAGEKELQRAMAEWQQQLAEYQAALSLAKTDEQRAELPPPSPDEVAPKIWRAVRGATGTRERRTASNERDRKGRQILKTTQVTTYEFEEPWAAPAVVWLVQHPDAFAKIFEGKNNEVSYFARALLDSIERKHYSAPMIAEVCPKLAESSSDMVYSILNKIYTQNNDPKAKSCAALALSILLANPAMSSSEGGYARTRSRRIYYIKQALNLAPQDTMFGAASLTQVAEEQIYRLRTLSNGCIPPRMTLTDMQGKPAIFPQEGKANLLFFWEPGEEVGLNMMSKQRALLKQYPELVICPIVPYGNREALNTILQENHIETCYMDDAQGTAGSAYRVTQLPLAILVDARAHILYIGYPDMQLQTALDAYYQTAQKKEPQPAAIQRPIVAPSGGSDTPPALRDMPKL